MGDIPCFLRYSQRNCTIIIVRYCLKNHFAISGFRCIGLNVSSLIRASTNITYFFVLFPSILFYRQIIRKSTTGIFTTQGFFPLFLPIFILHLEYLWTQIRCLKTRKKTENVKKSLSFSCRGDRVLFISKLSFRIPS